MTEAVDPYLDPATGILRNIPGFTTQGTLNEYEALATSIRAAEAIRNPRPLPNPTGDLAELQAIHKWIFQDIYDWPGQLRTVDIYKTNDFFPHSRFAEGARYTFGELAAANYLMGLDRGQFIDRLAGHFEQVNHLHPFREGNGRTQRFFWSRVSRDAGWELDWRSVSGQVMDQASIAGDVGDLQPLKDLFHAITTSATPAARRGPEWVAQEIRRLVTGPPLDTPRRSAPRTPRPRRKPGPTPGASKWDSPGR